jgi:hypothetical protein
MKSQIMFILIIVITGFGFCFGTQQEKMQESLEALSLRHISPIHSENAVELLAKGIEANLNSIQDIRATITNFRTVNYGALGTYTSSGKAKFIQKGIKPSENIRINYEGKYPVTEVCVGGIYSLYTFTSDGRRHTSYSGRDTIPRIQPLSLMGIGQAYLLKHLQARDKNGRRNLQLLGWTNYNNDSCLIAIVPMIDAKNLFYRLWVSPSKGYVFPCLQILQVWGKDSAVVVETKVTFRQTATGKWVAALGVSQRLNMILPNNRLLMYIKLMFTKPKYRLNQETSIEFGEILLNTNIQDSEFQLFHQKPALVQDNIH